MFSMNSLPYDIIRHIVTFIPIQSMRWSRALTLQSIKNNKGLETVIIENCPPLDILKSLVGKRTQTLSICITDKYIFQNLKVLNMPQLQTLKIFDYTESKKIFSLEPLRDLFSRVLHKSRYLSKPKPLPLKNLTLNYFYHVRSLEPLRGLCPSRELCSRASPESSLESLSLNYFYEVDSIEPLREMRPKSLILTHLSKVKSLKPLREMRPKNLTLEYFPEVKSFEPLRELCSGGTLNSGGTLENLTLDYFPNVYSLEPLQEFCSKVNQRFNSKKLILKNISVNI